MLDDCLNQFFQHVFYKGKCSCQMKDSFERSAFPAHFHVSFSWKVSIPISIFLVGKLKKENIYFLVIYKKDLTYLFQGIWCYFIKLLPKCCFCRCFVGPQRCHHRLQMDPPDFTIFYYFSIHIITAKNIYQSFMSHSNCRGSLQSTSKK